MNPDDVPYDALFAALAEERALADDLAAKLDDVANTGHRTCVAHLDIAGMQRALARYREARQR